MFGLIPARGGSKGILRKNLSNLHGRCLIDYTLDAAVESDSFTHLAVSSDSEEILLRAESFGVLAIPRPAELSKDWSTAIDVVSHFLQTQIFLESGETSFCYLQPTSPLRDSKHIRSAIELFDRSGGSSLISVCAGEKKYLKAFIEDHSGRMSPLCVPRLSFGNRQSLPNVFLPNGAIYICNSELFLQYLSFCVAPCIPFVMDERSSLDIDSIDDLKIAEAIMREDNK